MSEILSVRNRITAGVMSAAALMTLSSCAEEEPTNTNGSGGNYVPGGGSNIETTVELAKWRIKLAGQVAVPACMSVQRAVDTDCDGTPNHLDRLPFQKDFLDTDGDYVTDAFDLYPNVNDWSRDADGDLIIDAFDTYHNLNDLADPDNDSLPNMHDIQPHVPQYQTTTEQDYRDISDNTAYYAQVNEQFKTYLEFDTSPLSEQYDSMYTDTDSDGAIDYWDTDPDSWMNGGEYDPYKPGSDAWYDDDNNGWDSDY